MSWRLLQPHGDDSPTESMPPVAGVDDLDKFAADLRVLRGEAGNPTLAALDRQTGISKSVLSDAFAGKALPTERTILGVTAALGADPDDWLERRHALETDGRPTRPGPAVAPASVRRRTAIVAAACCFVVGAALASVTTWLVVGPAGSAAARVAVQAGADPANTPCVDDAVVTASVTRALETQLQIVYSEECHAAWARITRYDGAATGNSVSASIYRQIAPTASDRQDTVEPDAQSAYTTLIVRDSPDVRLCASGSLTVDGQQVDLGDPICM